jgi:hypothetical protein
VRNQLVRCPRGHGRLVVDAECGVDRGLPKEISDCKRQRLESRDCHTTKDHVTWWGSPSPTRFFVFLRRFSAPGLWCSDNVWCRVSCRDGFTDAVSPGSGLYF